MVEAKIEEIACEDRISELPEDLLVTILSFVSTKDAVATMFLSKRWLSLWTMVQSLEYKDGEDGKRKRRRRRRRKQKSVWWFLDKSLKLHKALVINSLCMELGPRCPKDADVGKWIEKAVDRRVRSLKFKLLWSSEYPINLPKSLYTCKTLVELTLSHKILVDFPPSSCLPSLEQLELYYVVYKEEDSLVRFLSSCPVLKFFFVIRRKNDNVKRFIVKVPSLLVLLYGNHHMPEDSTGRCVVIDTPKLKHFSISDTSGDYCSIQNMPCLDYAYFDFEFDARLLRSLSSVLSLELVLVDDETLVYCSAITFSRLIKLSICPKESNWLEPLMLLLGNVPKLKYISVDCESRDQPEEGTTFSWNQPSSVPGCLSSQLEIFEWRGYGDRVEEEEEEFLTYILANSKCLKTVAFSIRPTINLKEQKPIINKLKDIPRVSTASHLLFNEKSTSLSLYHAWTDPKYYVNNLKS